MMKRTATLFSRQFFKALIVLPLFTSFAIAAAQTTTTATVSGFVNDPSGARAQAATVTFTDTATGVSTVAKTTSEGSYRITGLLPGTYRSTVSLPGFKTTVRDGIELHVEDQASIDYTLSVGSVSEDVTVAASTPLIETESPTVSQVIEGRQVLDTPLNGRNVMNLVALTPGVIPQGSTSGNTSNNTNGGGFTNPFAFNNYQIAGGLAGQSPMPAVLPQAPADLKGTGGIRFATGAAQVLNAAGADNLARIALDEGPPRVAPLCPARLHALDHRGGLLRGLRAAGDVLHHHRVGIEGLQADEVVGMTGLETQPLRGQHLPDRDRRRHGLNRRSGNPGCRAPPRGLRTPR